MGALLVSDYRRTASLINANEKLQVALIKKSLTRDFEAIGPDLHILIQSEHFQEYLASPSVETRHRLQNTFSLFARHHRLYYQIRFIDVTGQERVRVDHDGGKVVQVGDDRLQDKSDRYYFTETIKLDRGKVFVSPIDLNVERGKVQVPYKPMIRFAVPVFDAEGKKRGILILNYLAERMLGHFKEMLEGTWGHIELLNQDGYWIYSHKKERNWGFMFDEGLQFQAVHGNAWSSVAKKDGGHVKDETALFNFTTLFPAETAQQSLSSTPNLGHDVHSGRYMAWKIVSDVPIEVLTGRMWDNLLYRSGPVWLVLVIVLAIGSWRFAVNRLVHDYLQVLTELHAKVFSGTTEGVIISDPQGTILDVNNGFTRITGYDRDEALGRNPSILSSGRHDEAFYKDMWAKINSKGFWEGEIYNRCKDGSVICEWLRIATVFDRDMKVSNYVSVFSDFTEKKASEEELFRQAREDPLTGLANRAALNEFLAHELMRAQRTGNKVACLYLDLNDFKPINDTHGHDAGDVVLQEVASRLKIHARDSDRVARMGGDEFVVVLTDVVDRAQVDIIAQRILTLLEEEIETSWGAFKIGSSLGIAFYPDDATDQETLIQMADNAMYTDKREGKKSRI